MTGSRIKLLLTSLALVTLPLAVSLHAGPSGALYTTVADGTAVNWNIYPTSNDVYISGGPQNQKDRGLPDGLYYFQVTDPSGHTLLSTDNAECRQLIVSNGRIAGGTGLCPHANGTFNPANGTTPVKLAPFSPTPNQGGVNKVWLIPIDKATVDSEDAKVLVFANKDAKTDNFKVAESVVVATGSCQPSSSISAMTTSSNDVVSYVPKGAWSTFSTGIAVVSVEGAATLPTTNPIPTTDAINSCASNSDTGETVCTANDNHAYLISGLSATPTVTTLTTSGTGLRGFSGGSCTNCGVAMDAFHNKAVVALSLAGPGGFQFLDLSTDTFEPAFQTQTLLYEISEDPLIDPVRNLLLNATENNQYELVDVTTTTGPSFYENAAAVSGELDSSGADCQTGIILAPAEFTYPSQVYIANLSSTAATFTPGSPAGTWTAPSQVQTLTESSLSAGASGIAVAQGTHVGVVSGEFGGDAITAIGLPTALDTSTAVPAIQDWVSCSIGNAFNMGLDPHTLTAYQSPNSGHAIALLVNAGATTMAVVDLTNLLDATIVPRTAGGHACASGPLPATVVSFLAVN